MVAASASRRSDYDHRDARENSPEAGISWWQRYAQGDKTDAFVRAYRRTEFAGLQSVEEGEEIVKSHM